MNALHTSPTATFFQASPKTNPSRLTSFWRRLNEPRQARFEVEEPAICEPRTSLSDTVAEALRWYAGQDAR